MSLEIKPILSSSIWEDYFQEVPLNEKTFLSSWNWGEFNQKMGDKIWRLGLYQNSKLSGTAQIIKIRARRGTFLFLPHSPHLKNWSHWPKLLEEIRKIARQEKAAFIRLSPCLPRLPQNLKIFQKTGFRPSPIHTHAEYTWNLDLKPDTETILKNMRKTTRYCIRKAQKEGVTVTYSSNPQNIEVYLSLQKETVARHGYVPFSKKFLRTQLETFAKDTQAALFIAHYQKQPLAAALVMFWQGSSFYHHGSSSLSHPKLQAPYLLQWEIILEAQRRGCTLHNFWGISESDNPHHPWAGLTLFKKGFGGSAYPILHSQDLPLSPLYWPTWIIERLRRTKRHL